MRSPVGELIGAVRSLVRPGNQAGVPYVANGSPIMYGMSTSGDLAATQSAAIDAFGQNGTLFAAITKLAQGVASTDWHMHRTAAPGSRSTAVCELCEETGVTQVTTHPALEVWDRPNDFFTSSLLVESFQQHVDLVGEGWFVVVWLAGRPIELWPVRPDRMAPVRDPKKFISGYVYRAPDGQLIPLRLDEVLTVRTPAPWDPYRGAGAVQTLFNNLWGAKYAAEWNRRFFENSAIPGGIVEMPVRLSDVEWKEFQERWAESHKGVRNAHTVAMLEYGAKWVDVRYTQKDMEFSELRRVNREEIREALAMHGHILGLSEDVNRANADAADVTFARRQTIPRLDRIRDMLNGPFLSLFGAMGKGYAFAYCSPVPEDREADNAERASKVSAYVQLLASGVDREDAARVAGLPPMRERVVVDDSIGAKEARAMAEMIQKIYLGVGKVISTAEAREILTGAGIFALPGSLPPEPVAPPAAAPAAAPAGAAPFTRWIW
jgi:HK97 family phage portal protein